MRNILGHQWAVDLLQAHLIHQRLRHAYLITGPTGVGRRTLAVWFAQAINCSTPPTPGEPCQQCRNCRQIADMQHPDLSVVQADPPGSILKVEPVRELQRTLALTPYQAENRIALLLRFEEANLNAANALLKTLEEPPPNVVMILTAQSQEDLLPTIVSRCESVRLRPLPLDETAAGLQTHWNLPEDEARELAHLSGGRPGYAITLHKNPETLEQRQTWLNDLFDLLKQTRVQRFRYANTIAKDKHTFRELIQVWASLWRDVMLRSSGAKVPITNLAYEDQITPLAGSVPMETTHGVIRQLERTLLLLDKNINTRLAAEVLMLELPYL